MYERLSAIGFKIEPLPFGEVRNFWARRDNTNLVSLRLEAALALEIPRQIWDKEPSALRPDDCMEVTKTLRPRDRGTARLLREYGDRLVCIRYRFDREHNKQLTTVEIIVDERDATESHVSPDSHNPPQQETAIVRINFHETELQEQAKQANGVWDPEHGGWILPYPAVRRLRLEGRIIK